jgi:hypothetical protein
MNTRVVERGCSSSLCRTAFDCLSIAFSLVRAATQRYEKNIIVDSNDG